jgi:hypothetical protein
MTSEQRAALREAAERVVDARFEYDRSSRDWPGTHYEREMKDELLTARAVWAEPAHPAAVLALLDECEKLREALKRLLDRDERNTCQHEDTHRGGFLWEICDSCGAKWADDEGGKPQWRDPPEWIEARAALGDGA